LAVPTRLDAFVHGSPKPIAHVATFAKVYCVAGREKIGACVSQDGRLRIFDLPTSHTGKSKKSQLIKPVTDIPLRSSWVMSCAISPNEEVTCCGGLDNIVSLFSVKDGKLIGELGSHSGYVSATDFPTNDTLVSSSGDQTVRYWDLGPAKCVTRVYESHTGDCMAVRSSPFDRNMVLSTGTDSAVCLIDLRLERCVEKFDNIHESDINGIDWVSPSLFATAADSKFVSVFDLKAKKELMKYDMGAGLTSVCASRSGSQLFVGSDDHSLFGIDLLTSEIKVVMKADNRCTTVVTCGPWQSILLAGFWDSQARVLLQPHQ